VTVISGTAGPFSTVIVNVYDHHYGYRAGGQTRADASGAWSVSLRLLYNTDTQAYSNGRPTQIYEITEIPVFRVIRVVYRSHDRHGFHYRLDGVSSSHVPGQLVEVLRSGHIIGSGHQASSGYFSINFTVPTKSTAYSLQLRWSGNASNGVQYVLPGTSGHFHG
jgi:hypothetical protein